MLNIPQLPTSFSISNKKIGSAVAAVSVSFMMQAAREAVAQNEEGDLSHITACFDGTWQTRAHTTLTGIMSATSVDRGKVLGIEIMSKCCFVCHTNPTSQHKCNRNHKGASGGTEGAVYAILLFLRFISEVQAFVTQSIMVMGTGNHTKGWLQGRPMVPT
jgi:hypothetical protein